MNCKHIKKILITDYIDDEADDKIRKNVEEHLKKCESCGRFYEDLKKEAVSPFKEIRDMKVPDEVWDNIRAKIGEEKKAFDIGGILDPLKRIFILPKPALAMVSFLLFVVIALSGVKVYQVYNYNLTKDYLKDQMSYLLALNGDADGNGFDTSIENIFL